jgi:hypothetical protein
MSDNVQNLTTGQQRFVEWLALPKSERHPHTQELFAKELGVNEKTLRRWKKELHLDRVAAEVAREQIATHLPDIYGALVREAKRGNFQHIKLALEVAEHFTEEVNVNVNHQRDEAIRELSEFEQRRRAQLHDGDQARAVAGEGKT